MCIIFLHYYLFFLFSVCENIQISVQYFNRTSFYFLYINSFNIDIIFLLKIKFGTFNFEILLRLFWYTFAAPFLLVFYFAVFKVSILYWLSKWKILNINAILIYCYNFIQCCSYQTEDEPVCTVIIINSTFIQYTDAVFGFIVGL